MMLRKISEQWTVECSVCKQRYEFSTKIGATGESSARNSPVIVIDEIRHDGEKILECSYICRNCCDLQLSEILAALSTGAAQWLNTIQLTRRL